MELKLLEYRRSNLAIYNRTILNEALKLKPTHMQQFDFQYNFSKLDLINIWDKYRITQQEIISVFENPRSRLREVPSSEATSSIFISIGGSSENRIIMVAFTYPYHTIDFIGAAFPDEDDIDQYYCQ